MKRSSSYSFDIDAFVNQAQRKAHLAKDDRQRILFHKFLNDLRGPNLPVDDFMNGRY